MSTYQGRCLSAACVVTVIAACGLQIAASVSPSWYTRDVYGVGLWTGCRSQSYGHCHPGYTTSSIWVKLIRTVCVLAHITSLLVLYSVLYAHCQRGNTLHDRGKWIRYTRNMAALTGCLLVLTVGLFAMLVERTTTRARLSWGFVLDCVAACAHLICVVLLHLHQRHTTARQGMDTSVLVNDDVVELDRALCSDSKETEIA